MTSEQPRVGHLAGRLLRVIVVEIDCLRVSTPVAIMGPTAVGKSSLAMKLAQAVDGEIISADALQAYRGFDIGTAKPTQEDRRRVPHHLIDILEPDQAFSAGEFARLAREAIAAIQQRGRVALIVGGSGLYLRALLEGISPIPATDPAVRDRLRRQLDREGLEPLQRRLTELDPPSAARLRPGDTQRVLRALEVVLSTGRPLSTWLAEDPVGDGGLAAHRIGLTLPRSVLYDRIAERVRMMIQSGWEEEVEGLLQRGLSPELPAFQAIGYRQLALCVRQEMTLEEAIADTVRASRRYAKRQMTWFRREEGIRWVSMEDPDHCFQAVTRLLTS